jgi:hypothetical protein
MIDGIADATIVPAATVAAVAINLRRLVVLIIALLKIYLTIRLLAFFITKLRFKGAMAYGQVFQPMPQVVFNIVKLWYVFGLYNQVGG